MAARSGATSDSESSSSSDAEELARCREAAMPAWGLEQRPRGAEKPRADAADIPPASQPSLRHRADEHEQDGNELQTTPEFRAHVAKKLGALLDSAITIWEAGKEPGKPGLPQEASRDDGPGRQRRGLAVHVGDVESAPSSQLQPWPSRALGREQRWAFSLCLSASQMNKNIFFSGTTINMTACRFFGRCCVELGSTVCCSHPLPPALSPLGHRGHRSKPSCRPHSAALRSLSLALGSPGSDPGLLVPHPSAAHQEAPAPAPWSLPTPAPAPARHPTPHPPAP
nr:protein CUSTOS isoform X1 [Oryctolagus cuniculus]